MLAARGTLGLALLGLHGKSTAVVEPRSGDISARVQEKGKKITGEARRSRACPSRLGGEGRLVVAAATAAGRGGCRVATAKNVAVAVAREAGVRWVRHGGWYFRKTNKRKRHLASPNVYARSVPTHHRVLARAKGPHGNALFASTADVWAKASRSHMHSLDGNLTCSLDPAERTRWSINHMDEAGQVAGRDSDV